MAQLSVAPIVRMLPSALAQARAWSGDDPQTSSSSPAWPAASADSPWQPMAHAAIARIARPEDLMSGPNIVEAFLWNGSRLWARADPNRNTREVGHISNWIKGAHRSPGLDR